MIKAVNVHLTDKCNYNCDICFETKDLNNPTYLDTGKLLAFISDYAPGHVGFVGGEPTCHPDLNEILAWLKDNNIHSCVVSNGHGINDLNPLPANLSVGIDNDQAFNDKIITFIQNNPEYCKDNLEITITPTDVSVIDSLIEYYKPKCKRINISMLAFWDRKDTVLNYISQEYIDKMKSFFNKEGIVFFGDINNIDGFYNKTIIGNNCVAPLNIYPDGHLEFCDLNKFPTGMTIDNYDQQNLVKQWVYNNICSDCNLLRS